MFQSGLIKGLFAALISGLVFANAAQAADRKPFFEDNTNRWGADYSIFDVKSGAANACYNACVKDKQCLAWTYHRPGTRGKLGECHLKSKVAHRSDNPCCISGVMVGPQADGKAAAAGNRKERKARARAERQAENLFKKAKLTSGAAIGLPEMKVAALNPPMKITPVAYTDEF